MTDTAPAASPYDDDSPDALEAALRNLTREAAAEILSEPHPNIWPGPANTIHALRLTGEVTLRDDLPVQDGEEVTIVLTARVNRKTTQHREITFADATAVVTAVQIVNGDDVISGPSSDELWKLQREAWEEHDARRKAAVRVLHHSRPEPVLEPAARKAS